MPSKWEDTGETVPYGTVTASPSEQPEDLISIEEAWGGQAPQGKATSKPIIGWDGNVVGYEDVKSSPDVDSVLKWKYKDNFDDSQWFGDGVTDVWNMGVLGKYETNAGRTKRFKEMYPEGDIMFRSAAGEDVVMARKTPDEPYRRVSGWQTTVPSAIGNLATAAGVIAELTPLGRSVGVLGRIAMDTGATALGAATEEAIMQQLEEDRPSSPWLKGGIEGGIQAVVSTLMSGGGVGIALKQLLKEPPATKAQKEAFEAWQRRGLTPYTRFQYSLNPMTKAVQAQRQAMSQEALTEAVKVYESLGVDGLQKYIAENGFRGISRPVLQELVEKQLAKFDELRKNITSGKTSFAEGSEELANTMDMYFTLAKREEDTLYREARALAEDVEFDLEPVHRIADDIEASVRTRMAGGEIETINPPTTALQEVIDTIRNMNPVISHLVDKEGGVHTSMDQLKELRRKVWNLYKENDPRHSTSVAVKRLYGAITDIMNNPVKGNPDFLPTWQKANEFFNFNRSLEALEPIIKLGKADPYQYARLARQLTQPDQADSLLFMKDFISKSDPAAWDTFRDSFVTSIVEDPLKGINKLDSFAKAGREDALRALVTADEEKLIRQAADELTTFKNSPLWKRREEGDYALAHKAIQMVNAGDLDQLANQIALAGGKNSDHAAALRAGIVQHWYDEAKLPNLYGENDVINAERFLGLVKASEESGKLNVLFRPEDWDWLKDMKAYATPLGTAPVDARGNPVGAAIQAGEQAGKASRAVLETAEQAPSLPRMTKEAYKLMKLPLGMNITARLLDADARVRSINPKATPTARTLSLLSEFVKRGPVIFAEGVNSIEYEEEDIYAPLP